VRERSRSGKGACASRAWPGGLVLLPPAGWFRTWPASSTSSPPVSRWLAGGRLPADRPYDSHSLVPLFRGTGSGSRNEVFYDDDDQVTDVRQGPWKLHQKTIDAASGLTKSQIQSPPLLFNMPVL